MQKKTSDVAQDKKLRYTVILSQAAHDKLTEITKAHVLSQADVFEALLANLKDEQWAPVFAAVREAKVNARTSKRAILNRFSKMSPEELAKLSQLVITNQQGEAS